MGLVPEFFILLGINIFLAMSLLSALLDDDLPSHLQYFFQVAAIVGLGQLLMSQGLFGRDPANLTRFLISVVYLALAVSNVVGLNVYLAAVRRKMALASTFSGTVTVPTLMISAILVSSFLGTGGEVGFTPATIMILAVSALVASLSIVGLLREASKHISNAPGGPRSSRTGPVSTAEIAGGPVSKPPGAPGIGLPLRLPSRQEEDWEESPTKEEDEQ
jgi:hypothetical protein